MTRYLPAEVTILVDAEDGQGTFPPGRHRAVYEGAMDWLNERLHEVLRRPPPRDFGSAFEEDMFPVTLQARCNGSTEILGPPKQNGGRDPWVPLPDSGKLLCFYDINARDGRWPEQTGSEIVRELVNLINRRFLATPFPERAATPAVHGRVAAATPHWLASGAPEGFTDGGPAARPVTAEGGRWRFDFRDERLDDLVRHPGDAEVVVAVLDTSPTMEQVRDAARRYPENWLLREIAGADGRFTIDEELSVPSDVLKHLDHYLPSWKGGLQASADQHEEHEGHVPPERYLMPDHGLVTASVVRQLAPTAAVRLIRVLSDYGVGDLLALAGVLRRLPQALNPRGDKRLVVNLSLVAGMPPSGEMLGLWFPHSATSLEAVTSWQADIARTLDYAHRTLAETVGWLTSQGVLVVAAAGNDGGVGPARPEPRVPARYEEVLAVAAVQRESFEPSSFSNRGDVAVMGNGVAVFGGDARPAQRGDADDPWVTVDGVVGAFSAPTLPLGGGENTSGWAAWAGTSFATPIVAAVAADVLTREPGLSPARVIERVREHAQLADDPLDRDGPLDCPTILATQVRAATAS